jgi:hypothetical protein
MKKLLLALLLVTSSAYGQVFRPTGPFVYTGALAGIPATCAVGTLSFITNATAGQNIYECASANTWTQQTGGGGTPAGSSGDIQTNNAGAFGAITPGANVATFLQTPTSANFAAMITNETGTGSVVLGTSPTFTTGITVNGDITVSGLVDGYDVSTMGAKVAGLPDSAISLVGTNGTTTATPEGRINFVDAAPITWSAAVNGGTNSNDVTATLGTVTVAKGGTGTASTLTGLVRGSATAMTAAELSGDVSTSGSNAVTLATVTVAKGGTNSTAALNNNRHMVSSSGAIVESAAATNGQLLIGSTSAAPVIAAPTGSGGTTVTLGAGTIAISSPSSPSFVNFSSTSLIAAPGDGNTVFFGPGTGPAVTTEANSGKLSLPRAATVIAASVTIHVASTLGSSETFTCYLRLNSTTDITISSSVKADAVTAVFNSGVLSQAIATTDWFNGKCVFPTWATNPAQMNVVFNLVTQ